MLHCLIVTNAAQLLAQAEDGGWLSSAWSVILMVFGFSLVIFVHELGHFLAAKWAGVRVERFAIGFGAELVGFTRGETRYSLNLLPLGGYVKMLGQEDFVVDKTGELKVKADPSSFTNKPVSKRMVIVSAGVIMNLLFAAIAFGIVNMAGILEPPAIIGTVQPGSPAANAGLMTGDRILAINGEPVRTFRDMMYGITLSDADVPLELTVERNGRPLPDKPRVLPRYVERESIRQIGVSPGMNCRVALPSIVDSKEPLPNELQKYDELSAIIRDGMPVSSQDLAEFRRAIIEAEGDPVKIAVKRPRQPKELSAEQLAAFDPEIESDVVEVDVRATWVPTTYEPNEAGIGSFLGLVPRLTIASVPENKPFARAGALAGDVIVRLGDAVYPNYDEVKQIIEVHADRELRLDVRRPWAPNHDLSAAAVRFASTYREDLIAAGKFGIEQAVLTVGKLSGYARLAEPDRDALARYLQTSADVTDLRRKIEQVDIHELKLVPTSPFSLLGLFGSPSPPQLDAWLTTLDEDHVVVADVIEEYGDRPTAAQRAGIPRGAVFKEVDGRPVRWWYVLSSYLRERAGNPVEITYRLGDETRKTILHVPQCLETTLEIPRGARVVKIDGQSSSTVQRAGETPETIYLPDWRAIEGILSQRIGRSVTVEYVTEDGKHHEAFYTVTAENTDPWVDRVQFAAQPVMCYYLSERHAVTNPIKAVAIGFQQAYKATVQTIQSIRHIVITRKVGLKKVSGPIGIFRLGTQVADSGLMNLLFFFAIISANLAVINFLPMPIVDGGLFLFLILEKIRGEPVSIKTQVATQIVGIALIATLFIMVTYQDIKNWIMGT